MDRRFREKTVTSMHEAIWQTVMKTGESAAIYEDDAVFIREAAIAEPPENTILYLSACFVVLKNYKPGGMSPLATALGAHAYIVNQSVAGILLKVPYYECVDRKLQRYLRLKHLCGIVQTPYACYQSEHPELRLTDDRKSFQERFSARYNDITLDHVQLLGKNVLQTEVTNTKDSLA
jgi:hypothetical protein